MDKIIRRNWAWILLVCMFLAGIMTSYHFEDVVVPLDWKGEPIPEGVLEEKTPTDRID